VHKYKDDDRLQLTFEPCMSKLTTLQHEESTELVENMYQLSSLHTAPPPVATTKHFSSDSACNALVWDRTMATHLLVNTFKSSLTGNGSRTAEAYTRGKNTRCGNATNSHIREETRCTSSFLSSASSKRTKISLHGFPPT
jgi:hypothetical protein